MKVEDIIKKLEDERDKALDSQNGWAEQDDIILEKCYNYKANGFKEIIQWIKSNE